MIQVCKNGLEFVDSLDICKKLGRTAPKVGGRVYIASYALSLDSLSRLSLSRLSLDSLSL